MVFVDIIFNFTERGTKSSRQFFKEDFSESITQEGIVKVCYSAPGSEVTGAAFGDECMDVGIPFQVTSECMKDANKTRSKRFLFVDVRKHPKDNITDRGKQQIEEMAIF